MKITIPVNDFITAGSVGFRRATACLHQRMERKGGNSHPQDPVFDQAIHGAVAEFIVARMFNLNWAPKIGDNSKGDVGGIIEVRCRNPRSGDEIGIHKSELTMTPFVGVLWRGLFNYEIAGWIYGSEANERGTWNDLRECFYVRRPYRTMDELHDWVALQPYRPWVAQHEEAS